MKKLRTKFEDKNMQQNVIKQNFGTTQNSNCNTTQKLKL